MIARLINQPLKQLSFAASRVRDGDFDASHLDEKVVTSEIREVNIGFNRMAEQLAKIEQDRAVMLAGISHDLRTPLARLRLETEMSVADEDAREHMAADIAQLDAIIDKFLDYARPGQAVLSPVSLAEIVEACVYPFKDSDDIRVNVDVPPNLRVMADEVELARVISNLLENARRYGKSVETGVAIVDIASPGARPLDTDQGPRPRHRRVPRCAGEPDQTVLSRRRGAHRCHRRRSRPVDRGQDRSAHGGLFCAGQQQFRRAFSPYQAARSKVAFFKYFRHLPIAGWSLDAIDKEAPPPSPRCSDPGRPARASPQSLP